MYRLFALLLIFLSFGYAAEEWRVFTDRQGRSIEARVVSVENEDEKVTLVVRRTNKQAIVPFANLSDEDVEFLKEWTADAPEEDEEEVSKKLYPVSKQEIRARIREIEQRDAPEGIDRDQQKAVNEVNIYRYLCGVPDDVEADEKMIKQAEDAAQACRKHGSLSHDLGHSTDVCNLSQGSSMIVSVMRYIDDAGDNNRERRGHRRWVLNPPMKKTGFGEDAEFSAMVAMDHSGKQNRKPWSYPGRGFFPKEYLHGNAWSLYLTEKAPDKKELKVEVYELKKRPDKAFSMSEEIPGTALAVPFVYTFDNAINFEPQAEPIVSRGIYWVRIKGGGVSEGYLVEIF